MEQKIRLMSLYAMALIYFLKIGFAVGSIVFIIAAINSDNLFGIAVSFAFTLFVAAVFKDQVLMIKGKDVFYRSWFSWKKMNLDEVKIISENTFFYYTATVRIGKAPLPLSLKFWYGPSVHDKKFFLAVKELIRENQSLKSSSSDQPELSKDQQPPE